MSIEHYDETVGKAQQSSDVAEAAMQLGEALNRADKAAVDLHEMTAAYRIIEPQPKLPDENPNSEQAKRPRSKMAAMLQEATAMVQRLSNRLEHMAQEMQHFNG